MTAPSSATTASMRSCERVAVNRAYPFTPSAPCSTQAGRGLGKPCVNCMHAPKGADEDGFGKMKGKAGELRQDSREAPKAPGKGSQTAHH